MPLASTGLGDDLANSTATEEATGTAGESHTADESTTMSDASASNVTRAPEHPSPAAPPSARALTSEQATAQCLHKLGHSDWLWLRAPRTAGERVAQVMVLVVVGLCLGGMLALVIRQRDNKPLDALLLLGLSLLSAGDGWTDVLLASQWWRCGHGLWAGLAVACVALSTLFTLYVLLLEQKYALFAAAVAQLAAVVESAMFVAEGEHTDVNKDPNQAVSPFTLKYYEAVLEAAPQMFLQTYVLLHVGVDSASTLTWLSLSVSLAGLSNMFGESIAHELFYKGRGRLSTVEAVVARTFAACGAASRGLAIALFACSFHTWAVAPLLVAYAVIFYLVRASDPTVPMWVSFLLAFVYGSAPVMRPLGVESDDERIHAFLSLVEVVLTAIALGSPSAWRTAQPVGALTGLAGVFAASWLGKVVAMVALLSRKDDQGVSGYVQSLLF